MYPKEPITIIVVVYGLHGFFRQVIKRMRASTEYPHRIVVGENKSWASKEIRRSIREFLSEGLIDRAYLYEDNYMLNVYEHMFHLEPKAHLTVMTDGDLLLPELDYCWLTKFVNYFDEMPDMMQLGLKPDLEEEFAGKNSRHSETYLSKQRMKYRLRSFNANQVLAANGKILHKGEAKMLNHEIRNRCSNLHYGTIRTEFLDDFFANSGAMFSDGNMCRFTLQKRKAAGGGFAQCRLESAIVKNLSNAVTEQSHPKYFRKRQKEMGRKLHRRMKIEKFKVIE